MHVINELPSAKKTPVAFRKKLCRLNVTVAQLTTLLELY